MFVIIGNASMESGFTLSVSNYCTSHMVTGTVVNNVKVLALMNFNATYAIMSLWRYNKW